MAARRRLPGLPAQLRGLERRRRRRPARHHRAPRLSRPGRPRHRRHVAVADLPVARARPRLRRQRPRARRPAVRDRGGFRPPRRGRPSARHPGRARPGHEPHEPQHPWFVDSRARRDGPYADWYLWRDPSGYGPGRRAAPAEQLGLVLRWPGLAMGRGPRAVLLPHVPGRAAGAGLARRRVSRRPSSGWSAAGWRAAWTGSGWMSSTSSSSTRSCRSNPTQPGSTRVGPPDPCQRRRSAGLPGADRPLSRTSSTSGPVGCRSASCSTARSSERPA